MEDEERPRTRRRGAALEAHILESAWLELAERGWSGLTMEGVATRAGTGKASVYARWPSKSQLIRAAAHRMSSITAPAPSAGATLEDDLVLLLHDTAVAFAGPLGEAMRSLVAGDRRPDDDREIEDMGPVQLVVDVVERARRAGRLGDGPVPVVVLNSGLTVLTYTALAQTSPPREAYLRSIVHELWVPAIERHAGLGHH